VQLLHHALHHGRSVRHSLSSCKPSRTMQLITCNLQGVTRMTKNYSVCEAGNLSDWKEGEFPHPAFQKPVRGKFFLAEPLGLTGMEVSLNSLPPKAAVPFLHSHREHEELYLFLSGQGELLVDGEITKVGPGSAVRVATAGKRAWRNTGDDALIYVVVQAKAGSLAQGTIKDGQMEKEPPVWG
jgi:uncharacterized cupin superfamily protein